MKNRKSDFGQVFVTPNFPSGFLHAVADATNDNEWLDKIDVIESKSVSSSSFLTPIKGKISLIIIRLEMDLFNKAEAPVIHYYSQVSIWGHNALSSTEIHYNALT